MFGEGFFFFLLLMVLSPWSSCDPLPKKIINVADAPVGKPIATPEQVAQLPDTFDARSNWPECISSLGKVDDQGTCGGCWAFITTAVAADRFCIASKGAITDRLSPWHLLQCCGLGDCADGIIDFGGCAGGDPWGTWRFMATRGVVTATCKPYPSWVRWFGIHPFGPEVTCRTHCLEASSSPQEFFARSYYRLPVDEATIRLDIATHGPVVAHLNAVHMKGFTGETIYQCAEPGEATHGVRLIGWGQLENGDKYWLAVNSWGRDWGDRGTFRIARGTNSCHIEEFVSSMIPAI